MALALAMIFFYVPTDVSEGYSQRIFYFHVPIALTTYFLFTWGAVNGARFLLKRDMSLDLKSYVPMHLGVIFGSLTLVTGSIWANIAWGTWRFWGDTQLTTFLIIFLFNWAYIGILNAKMGRMERQLDEIAALMERRAASDA